MQYGTVFIYFCRIIWLGIIEKVAVKEVFFVRAGITNFQKALSDGDTLNQKKVWIYQPSLGAGFKIKNVNFWKEKRRIIIYKLICYD